MTKTRLESKADLLVYPAAPVLATCGEGDDPNIITLSTVATICLKPRMLGVSVNKAHGSNELFKQTGEFVINFPSQDQVRWVDYCGSISGQRVDKWEACGCTPIPADEVQVPLIAECPVNMECRVEQVLELGSHDLFASRVVAIHIDEVLLGEDGAIDLTGLRPLAYFGRTYWEIGEPLAKLRFSIKEEAGQCR